MPKPTPLPPEVRARVATDIRAGTGRNAIARAHGISTGAVSAIARENHLTFADAHKTAKATHCARIDAAIARVHKEQSLIEQQSLALTQRRLRTARRIEKRITDTNRFHKPLNI